MKSKNTYITQHSVMKIVIDDVDHELKKEFCFKYETDDDFELENDFIITNEASLQYTSNDSEIVNIDTLINSLETLKKKGSTHVAVDWNCDHLSYELYGYRVNLAEDNEIEEYQYQKQISSEKRKQISELQNQIYQLRNEL